MKRVKPAGYALLSAPLRVKKNLLLLGTVLIAAFNSMLLFTLYGQTTGAILSAFFVAFFSVNYRLNQMSSTLPKSQPLRKLFSRLPYLLMSIIPLILYIQQSRGITPLFLDGLELGLHIMPPMSAGWLINMLLLASSWMFAAWCVLWIYPTRETLALHEFEEEATLEPLGLGRISGDRNNQVYYFKHLARMNNHDTSRYADEGGTVFSPEQSGK